MNLPSPFGYINAAQALELGFTHHGSCFGIPVWMTVDVEGGPMVATKLELMERVMTFVLWISVEIQLIAKPYEDPQFAFVILGPIEESDDQGDAL